MTSLPRKRTGLIVNDLGDERVVFDPTTNTAHQLTSVAARVLEACDGSTSVHDTAASLGVSEEHVVTAVDELESAGLVEAGTVDRSLTRRRALQGGAVVTAAAVVASVAIPHAAAAASATGPAGGGGPSGATTYSLAALLATSLPNVPSPFGFTDGVGGSALTSGSIASSPGPGGTLEGFFGTEASSPEIPGFPIVGLVTGTGAWKFATVDAPNGVVFYHPGPTDPAVITFTNTTGAVATIEFSGAIIGRDDAGFGNGTTISFSGSAGVPTPTGVVTGATTGATGNTASFDATFTGVPANGTIYISLGNNGNYGYDGSEIDLTVTVS